MKITSVEFHPDGSSAVCELSFRDPTRQLPYNVKGITGLDADEIVPQSYKGSGSSVFNNMMLVQRNIVALIETNPDYSLGQTPGSLRDDIYRMIASSKKALTEVQFKDGNDVKCNTVGIFRKVEAPLFEEKNEIKLTIECIEPFLKAPEPVSINVVGLDPSLTVIEDPVSTAPHGFTFALGITAALDELVFTDPDDDDWNFTIIPLGGFLVDDVVFFSSEYNNKYLYLVRDSVVYHLADAVQSGSVWPIMVPGDTTLSVSDGPSLDWVEITYYPTFWGV